MPTTRVIKPTPVEATRKPADRSSPRPPRAPRAPRRRAAPGAAAALTLPAVRKSRASSCPRWPQRGRSVAAAAAAAPRGAAAGTGTGTGCPRRARSSPAVEPRPPPREQRSSNHSKAFTVIPPNPKKRREIQRKAEAELAALEELRLSRAMAYVSINPSSVGGCLSLEEVRLKQQQEMMLAKRKPKQIKQQVMEKTPVLTS